MNILVCGSRRWDRHGRAAVWRRLDEVAGDKPVHLVHGDCLIDGEPAGVDRWAQEWAEDRAARGIPTTWQKFTATAKYGPWPARGPRRSADMVTKFKAARQVGDKCLVFYVDPAADKGTRACHDLIKQQRMFANTFYYNEEVKYVDTQGSGNGDRGKGQAAQLAS